MQVEFHAPPKEGAFVHQIAVQAGGRIFHLPIQGVAAWPISHDKDLLRIENRRGGQGDTVSLFSSRGVPFEVIEARASDGIVVQATGETASSASFSVRLDASSELDETAKHFLKLKTDNRERPLVTLPIELYQKLGRRVSPRQFMFRNTNTVAEFPISISVSNSPALAASISVPEQFSSLLEASLSKAVISPDGTQAITGIVRLTNGVRSRLEANVVVEFRDGSQEELALTFLPEFGSH